MTAIWSDVEGGWRLLTPVGFEDEATLHRLVQGNPELLPLAGAPPLVVLGTEVRLGNGYADLLAVEPSGRLCILEIKLARNPEARRAVVAQVLTYAAYLRGIDPETLERDVLGAHLRALGVEDLTSAVASADRVGSFDRESFEAGLRDSLADGAFRLVIVLDQAPDELVQLVGYLEAVSERVVIDLVAVSAYHVGTARVLVPQRVEPARTVAEKATPAKSAGRPRGTLVQGAGDFEASIDEARPEHQEGLRRLLAWALALEKEGLVRLQTFHGVSGRKTLLPRLINGDAGLVTIWNDGGPSLTPWRSVFEKRAPEFIEEIERVAGTRLGQGNVLPWDSEALLEALTRAYRAAALANGR